MMSFRESLKIPEEQIPPPERQQAANDLKYNGTLNWLVQQMVTTLEGLEGQILSASMADPNALMQMTEWKAKRQILEVLLEQVEEIIRGDQGNE
jgi:hypothetical protein